ncbi:hypothetical protein [Lacimicrobium alkaliphilum]|uniref:Uncharacterized protein n=1 Tax=Lacimicrobium alkaliphilum TaxID=1526571 RepID=A0ABQ1R576_9ALTE|nr:hypothetical protein [Lacimicrobium alkaliphilum]GGD57541.1 hypothetical protein GCM10011357_11190 [Lacimicrobium alkaliphilum]
MLNKKILAASIAAAFTLNANAAIDLGDSDTALEYASQTITSGGSIVANAAFDVDAEVGLNLPATTTFYVRVELDNAELLAAVTGAGLLTSNSAGADTIAHEGGGQVGDDYTVYSFSSANAVNNDDVLSLALGTTSGLKVLDASQPVTITYKLYEASENLAALNGGEGEVTSKSLAALTFATGQDLGDTFDSIANTATVAKQFTEFTAAGNVGAGKKAGLGTVDLTVETGVLAADDSVQVVEADVFTTPTTTATVEGDLSFGTWWMSSADDCSVAASAANTLDIAEDMTSASVPSLNYTAGQTLCVEVDGEEVIPRNSAGYSVALASNTGVSGTIGSITYDTTSITVPYVTTFADYNQRIYILNNGAAPAPYSTTFQTEGDTTATAGSAAEGVVPAKTMIAIKASDLVTFTGKTRGAAVIEIEATTSNVEATTQTINLSDASTDTVTLKVQ